MLDIALSLKQHLGEEACLGSLDDTSIFVRSRQAMIAVAKEGGRSIDVFRAIVSVTVTAGLQLAVSTMRVLDRAYAKYRQAKLTLWYMSKDGPGNIELLLNSFGEDIPEFYPWLERDFFDRYLASSASILFMMGPPGTGKSSVLRNVINSRSLHAAATYDESVLASDAMFIEFVTSTKDILVIEDADNVLSSRERERNSLISRFLNFSDGIAKFPHKKIVFTTNLDSFDRIDPALTRQGRCFGALQARSLTYPETVAACRAGGVEPPDERGEYTIAQLLNHSNRCDAIAPRRIGFTDAAPSTASR